MRKNKVTGLKSRFSMSSRALRGTVLNQENFLRRNAQDSKFFERLQNKGFTLIELLVVLVIIGITISFALLAFGDFGGSKRIVFAAEQLENTLRLAQQQAIFESSTLGLRVDNKSYQVLKFQNASQWVTVPSKNLYKVHYFPSEMLVTLKTNFKTKAQEPSIIINPAGETNAFILSFGTNHNKTMAVLTGKENGELRFTTVPK